MPNTPSIQWQCLSFAELSLEQLYNAMRLRQEVFVLEQNCVYLDADGNDHLALHVLGYESESLITYCRILPPGVPYKEPSIGRVVTVPAKRGEGAGKVLMHKAIEYVSEHFANANIRISAQQYLEKFYQGFGFSTVSEPYNEDGILHIEMLKGSG